MKSYYSCTDSGCTHIVPQNIQHVVNGDFAKALDGNITFYVGEDNEFLAQQFNIKARLDEKPDVSGVIFFRLQQFYYGDNFDFPFLLNVIEQGYEVHISKERLSIVSRNDFIKLFSELYIFSQLNGPNKSQFQYLQLT